MRFTRILIRRSPNWRRSVFQAAELCLLFESFSLGPPFEEFQKMADFGVFAKFARTWLCGQLRKRGLHQNVLRWLRFTGILIRRSPNWRRCVFQAAEFGLLFESFSLGPPFEEFQKMADFGVFAKFARTRLCGQLRKRGLRQNVLRWLRFTRILIRRSPNWRRSVFQAAELGLLFESFSLGPPFEEFQKMADFGVFAKFARTRLCGQLRKRGLRQNVLRWLRFTEILIRRSPNWRWSVFQAAEFGLLFESFSLGPPFIEFQKMADFGVFAKFARTRLCGQLWKRGLRQNVLRWLRFTGILIRRSPNWRRTVFQAAEFGLLFESFSLGPPFEEFQKMADFGVFAKFARTRLCGQLRKRGLRQNVLRWLRFTGILIRRSPNWRWSVFQAAEFGLLFESFSLGPPFEEFQKMADFGVFAKFARTRLCGQLRKRCLRQNVLRWLRFTGILIRRSPNWRRSVFQAAEFGLLFESFSLGPPFEEFQKMADFGVFAKFYRTRLCGQLRKRGLRQNVLRWLRFTGILIRRSPNWRWSVFQAAEFGLLFESFSLGPPFEEFQKMADFGVFAKFARTRLCGQLRKRGLRQNVLRWLRFTGILIRRSPNWRRSVFQAAEFGLLFESFSLGPPFEEFQKMADFGVFAKFARTWLCGQLRKRGLHQNVPRWLRFTGILIRRSPNWRRCVFQAAEFGLLFESFSLGPPFEEFQKMADFGVFAKFARTRLCGQLRKRGLRQNVLR